MVSGDQTDEEVARIADVFFLFMDASLMTKTSHYTAWEKPDHLNNKEVILVLCHRWSEFPSFSHDSKQFATAK